MPPSASLAGRMHLLALSRDTGLNAVLRAPSSCRRSSLGAVRAATAVAPRQARHTHTSGCDLDVPDAVLLAIESADVSSWTPAVVAESWRRLAFYARRRGLRGARDCARVSEAASRLAEAQRRCGFGILKPGKLASVVHAWGVLAFREKLLLRDACASAAGRVEELSGQQAASFLHALGLLERDASCGGGLPKALCARLLQLAPKLKPQELSVIAYAVARLRLSNERSILYAVATSAAAPGRLAEFTTQGISNTMYAFGLLNFCHADLLRAVSAEVPRRLNQFTEQELANTTYALALQRASAEPLLRALCNSAQLRLAEFKPQGISNMLYALGVLGLRADAFLEAACTYASKSLPAFNSQDIANIVYALGLLDFPHEKILQAVADHVPPRLGEFTDQGVTNMLYAAGLLQFRHVRLLRALGDRTTCRLNLLTEQHISNAIYGLGLAGFVHGALMKELAAQLPHRIIEFKIQGLAMTTYGLSLGLRSPRTYRPRSAR